MYTSPSIFGSLRRNIVVALALALFAIACEESVDITDSIYRERMVVHCVLHPDSTIRVSITRTLPINVKYTEAAATLSDVAATITVENPSDGSVVERFDLTHTTGGIYVAPASSAPVRAGLRYKFNALRLGKSVHASTIVPMPAVIDSVDMVTRYPQEEWQDTTEHLRAFIRPRAGETYFLTSANFNFITNEIELLDTYGGAQLYRLRNAAPNGLVELVDDFWGYMGPNNDPEAAVVVSYDEPYYEFQRTYYTYTDRGPFGTGADIVHWTVEGDGIGLFIGRNFSFKTLD